MRADEGMSPECAASQHPAGPRSEVVSGHPHLSTPKTTLSVFSSQRLLIIATCLLEWTSSRHATLVLASPETENLC